MKQVQLEDCERIGSFAFIDWEKLKRATILITGSTGLIGSNLVNALAFNSKRKNLEIKLILPVRNMESAKQLFSWTDAEIFQYSLGEKLDYNRKIDYIIHLASPTSSKFFTEKPVDTLLSNIQGTKALLEWAKDHPIRKFIGLSSMEVYGFPQKGHKVKENELGSFETMNTRNSYPIAKLASESLCNAFWGQYGVPTVILRATQTFGPGIKYDDGRVFAQFMRCIMEKKDIILKSKGLTERPYLYTADAVSAIIIGMLNGVPGEAYTVANPSTYISIIDMAKMLLKREKTSISIRFDLADDISKFGYAETLFMDLDVSKLENLGWKPLFELEEMYERMMRYFTDKEV